MSIFIYFTLGLLTSLLFPPYFFFPLGFIIFPSLCLLLDSNRKNNSNLKIFNNFSLFGFGFFISYLFWVKNPFFVFEETKNFFQNLKNNNRKLDALVNVAGILRFDNSHEVEIENWNKILEVNLN